MRTSLPIPQELLVTSPFDSSRKINIMPLLVYMNELDDTSKVVDGQVIAEKIAFCQEMFSFAAKGTLDEGYAEAMIYMCQLMRMFMKIKQVNE